MNEKSAEGAGSTGGSTRRGSSAQGRSSARESAAGEQGSSGARSSSASRSQPQTGSATRTGPVAPAGRVPGTRRDRYLVAPVPQHLLPPGLAAVGMDAVCEQLDRMPDTELIRRLGPSPRLAAAGVAAACPEVALVRTSAERAATLRSAQVHVEPDLPLTYTGPAATADPMVLGDPGMVVPLGTGVSLEFRVTGVDGDPVPGAAVYVMGLAWPAQGTTGRDGRVRVTLSGDTAETVQSVYVKPAGQYWDCWLTGPQLDRDGENLVSLVPLSHTFPELTERQHYTWGQRAMRLDQIPPTFRAFGIKVASVDSGAVAKHPDLKDRVRSGMGREGTAEGDWATDLVGHGTHCAGIIGGGDTGAGSVGFAVDAEIDACQVLPGGRFSDLLAALDHCIDNDIDIVHLSVATPYSSALVAHKIADAMATGVACVAPAGDTAGPVAFPGNLPTVLTVGALGKLGEFPADTSHAAHVGGPVTPDALGPARFSCFGPEVDVTAPGVAVLSCAPTSDYAVLDGTSIAAAHVAGLMALVLAHHDDFRVFFPARGPGRVRHLFGLVRASCRPLAMLGTVEQLRTGAGLPDALVALGLAAPGVAGAPFTGYAAHPLGSGVGAVRTR
jgi:subtilisin family serine protease